MFRKFINREEEIRFMEEKYKENSFNFVVIYGRRRVGKTELIKQFIKNKQAIYFLADKRGTESNLDRFKEQVSEFLGEPKAELNTFDKVFSYLVKKAGDKRPVIVIDEFSYLVEKDDSIPSVFQLIIDEGLADSNFFLILSGSSVSLMEEGVLSARSPLYGRRTGQFKVKPLTFKDVLKFFPNYKIRESMEAYSLLGGVPFYLIKFDDKMPVLENIRQNILRNGEVLFEEVDFLLREELRDPATYKSILEAIASGCSKVGEISGKAGIETRDFDKYIKVLISLGYIEKLTPVTEKPKSKKTIYRIKDNFFRFWFAFCFPHISDLEIGNTGRILKSVQQDFNSFVGKAFESVCREFMKKKRFFEFTRLGSWWGHYRDKEGKRKEVEIDICGINEETKEILFGECKWQDKVNALHIMDKLKEKASHVNWHNEERKEHYAIFAKSFKEKIKEKNVYLFDLEDFILLSAKD